MKLQAPFLQLPVLFDAEAPATEIEAVLPGLKDLIDRAGKAAG